MWHWTRKTWPCPLAQSQLIHGYAWGLLMGLGNFTNRLSLGWKQQSKIVCHACLQLCDTKHIPLWYRRKKCQQIPLFLLLLMSLAPLCCCALGEYNIFLKHLPQLPLGFLPWLRLLFFHGFILVWPKFSCAQSKDLRHYGGFVKKGPSSFIKLSINIKSCIMKYVFKGTF